MAESICLARFDKQHHRHLVDDDQDQNDSFIYQSEITNQPLRKPAAGFSTAPFEDADQDDRLRQSLLSQPNNGQQQQLADEEEGGGGGRGLYHHNYQPIGSSGGGWTAGQYSLYGGIILLAFTLSLDSQSTGLLIPFATSSFNNHSLLSSVQVVQGIVYAVIRPPMVKVSNVFGKVKAINICICLYFAGYIQAALAPNVEMYGLSQLFYASGYTGLSLMVQLAIADYTHIIDRAAFIAFQNVPFLLNFWLGPLMTQVMLDKLTWRAEYFIFAIIVPFASLPLIQSFARLSTGTTSLNENETWLSKLKRYRQDLDIEGIALFVISLSLLLVPLTTMQKSTVWDSDDTSRSNAPEIEMLLAGVLYNGGCASQPYRSGWMDFSIV